MGGGLSRPWCGGDQDRAEPPRARQGPAYPMNQI